MEDIAKQSSVKSFSLDQARIKSLPASAYYIPDFISLDEERVLLEKIYSVPKPRWRQLTHRRLQAWPSELVRDRLFQAELPPWLTEPILQRLLALSARTDSNETNGLFSGSPHGRPNHVLINEYPPGIGIMPHKDGSAYFPVVCTVSLGASLCLDLYASRADGLGEPKAAHRILQEPRSLLITTDDLYTQYLHGISDVTQDEDLSAQTVSNWDLLGMCEKYRLGSSQRSMRTSLTYRDVLQVFKGEKKFAFLSRS